MTRKAPISHNKIELLHRISLILLIVFVCTAAFCGCVSAFDGTGTESDPFQISNAADLKQLADDVNGGEHYYGKYFRVTDNIDLSTICSPESGDSWTPIGCDEAHDFRGSFDGDGHTISNLYINKPSADYQGLFGCISYNSFIKNLTLINVNITGKDRVGGLLGYFYVSGGSYTIDNCSVYGNITGHDKVGGLIGWHDVYDETTGDETLIIKNSYVSGNVTGHNHVGGYIGMCGYADDVYDEKYNFHYFEIKNSGTSLNVTGNENVGGFVGYMIVSDSIKISDSYTTGKVSGTSDNIGGLIGYNYIFDSNSKINITNSYTTGKVYSEGDNVGGLIGHNEINGDNNKIKIINSYTTGDVYSFGGGYGSEVGGLIGYNENTGDNNKINITNSYTTGEVCAEGDDGGGLIGWNIMNGNGITIIKNSNSTGNITSCDTAGGLISGNDVYNGKTIIINSYSTGDVDGGIEGAGGLIGWNDFCGTGGKTIILNSYSIGYINSSDEAGGLIGWNCFESSVENNCLRIENCYASGNISGVDIGGLLGGQGNSGTNCKSYINNSAALNRYVNSTSNVGRIYGSADATLNLLNNYGWEGMKNGDNFFTEDNFNNGTNVSSVQVWGNESFYKNDLHWEFGANWSIDEDNNINYPLPYITSLDKKDTWRPKVIHLKPMIVTFNGNGASAGVMSKQGFTLNIYKALFENNFTKTRYTFSGWNESSSGPKKYDDKYVFGFDIPDQDEKMLYAVWIGNITNITLYFNNTTSFPSVNQTVDITYDTGTFNTSLTTPAKPGYTFLGYNNSTESSSVQVINDTLKLVQNADGYTSAGKWNNVSSDVELWAVWKPNITNVTLHFNNGSSAPNDKQIVNISYGSDQFNETLSPLNYPGYTFLGYFNKSSGGVQVINNALGLAPNAVNYTDDNCKWVNDTRNIVLWAKWEKIPEPSSSSGTSSSYYHTTTYIGGINSEVIVEPLCNVYFNSTGGSHVDDQTNLHRGDKVTEPMNPTKDGYAFKAWYTVDAYKWDFKNDTVNKSFTLYANWTAIPQKPGISWFWLVILIIAGVVITAVIIKIRHNKKEDYEKIS